MKNKNALTYLLLLFIVSLYSSCTSKEDQGKGVLKQHATTDQISFTHGTWRIDSVGENNQVIDNLVEDSIIQVFNFRKGGVMSAMEVKSTVTEDRQIGKWRIKKDSLYIFNETGNIMMRYGYEIDRSKLVLKGNFPITSTNKKKPTFYLSKYKKNQK